MAFWLSSSVKEVASPIVLEGHTEKDKKRITNREKISGGLGTISGMGTIISGGVLGYLYGFSHLPWPIHAAAAITILMALIGAFGIGGVYNKLNKAIDRNADILELQRLSKQLQYWGKALISLWLIVFLLMTLRHTI